MPSSDASSSWDFTAVIDLVRTPTRPRPESHRDYPLFAAGDNVLQSISTGHGLGDFTAVWDFLHPAATRDVPENKAASTESALRSQSDNETLRLSHRSKSKSISILKRSAKTKNIDAKRPGNVTDSTTESDGDCSVFDSTVPSKSSLLFVPPQVASVHKGQSLPTPPSSCEEDSTLSSYSSQISKSNKAISGYRSAIERKAGLVSKLSKRFSDFKIAESPTLNTKRPSNSIHIFVDASNISIGLHDSYKVQHGIPLDIHIKRLPLSFYNFSLILERCRPVAKRVLAGSDRTAAINEAERLGYEVNILSRVHKAKEYTPRQLKYRNGPNSGGIPETGVSSLEERWVEQCVDEILHLKMLESLIDTDHPATIVLATGDAAEAEYSGGFLRMVERALQKGWHVEVVSFAMNTSYAYKRKEFRAKWGKRFQLINLEDYVEEMLDL